MENESQNCFMTFFNSLYEILVNFEKNGINKPSKYDSYFKNEYSTKWNYDQFVTKLSENLARMAPEKSTITCAFIYLDRIFNVNKKLLKRQNLLNLVTIAIILSHKFNEDIVFIDKCYCEVLRTDISMFRSLEIIFCEMIKYKFFVSEKKFLSYDRNLLN